MNLKNILKKLPSSPGVYLFYNSKKELLYVGKATSLKSRVNSYFSNQQKSERPIESMIHEVKDIKYKKTDSVLEAIILEASYIKKFQPKYNVDLKDDKSWNYLAITTDMFPKLVAVRQREIESQKHRKHKNTKTLKNNWKLEIGNWKFLYGPFPHLNTREALKILHKLFFISRCEPRQKKACFDYQLGHCLGVCTGAITAKKYKQKVINPLTEFLTGHKKRLISHLNKRMHSSAKEQNFEEAARLRNQINALKHIQDITLLNKKLFNNSYPPTNLPTYQPNRIETYDISNLGSTGKVGSMVVFDEYGPVKSEYRKFKIKTVAGQSDVDCLKEIVSRRLKNDWPLPDLILVDGGVPQVNALQSVIRTVETRRGVSLQNKTPLSKIPVIGLAKGKNRKKNEFVIPAEIDSTKKEWIASHHSLLIRSRNEAHRFAINYQKKLRDLI